MGFKVEGLSGLRTQGEAVEKDVRGMGGARNHVGGAGRWTGGSCLWWIEGS